jgi:hypothetical protein
VSTWKRTAPPAPNRSADPRDFEPPHHDAPSKADYRQVWLAVCRQELEEANGRRLEQRAQRRLDAAQQLSEDPWVSK